MRIPDSPPRGVGRSSWKNEAWGMETRVDPSRLTTPPDQGEHLGRLWGRELEMLVTMADK